MAQRVTYGDPSVGRRQQQTYKQIGVGRADKKGVDLAKDVWVFTLGIHKQNRLKSTYQQSDQMTDNIFLTRKRCVDCGDDDFVG